MGDYRLTGLLRVGGGGGGGAFKRLLFIMLGIYCLFAKSL